MRIAVIGAGNMGCVYGANLARLGQDVTMIDTKEDHVLAMQKHGIKIKLSCGGFYSWHKSKRKTMKLKTITGIKKKKPLLQMKKMFYLMFSLHCAQ